MNELNAAILSQLSGGTALISALGGTAIYHLQAPDKAVYPYVVYSWQGGGMTNDNPHDDSETVHFIRAYSATSAKEANTIDALVSARLHKAALSVTGYTTVMCWREDDYETVETTSSGVKIYTAGGIYRIRITK